ncbi:hypothetical protein QC764_302225 [Podospora pseudoanserina]|uniref:Uncharacterized protein n=1 Tax=Podospora pseudoanserina TaxID=2609844 RepID=A0ABR0ICB3_9PEZI|nr:hypothetical protein QC764_302225 [Podospora pseudoanserina]
MASLTAEGSQDVVMAQTEDIELSAGAFAPPSPAKNDEAAMASPESEDKGDNESIKVVVPIEHVVIMRLDAKEVDKYEESKHDACFANHSDSEGLREGPSIWEKEGSTTTEQLTATYAVPFKAVTKKRSPVGDDGSRLSPGGRPILLVKSTIPTCGGEHRPRFVMRVVHEGRKKSNGHVMDGPAPTTKARGYGVVSPNPINRQILMQKHFHWACHQQSPLLSLPNSVKTAVIGLPSF